MLRWLKRIGVEKPAFCTWPQQTFAYFLPRRLDVTLSAISVMGERREEELYYIKHLCSLSLTWLTCVAVIYGILVRVIAVRA